MTGVNLIARFLAAYKFTVPFDQVWDDPALPSLDWLGLIDIRASNTSFLCDACDFPHSVKIRIDPITDKLGWRCREAGFVAANPEQIKSARFSPDSLATLIADALQCRRRHKAVMIENLLWNIGYFDFQNHDVNVFLASRIRDAEDASEIANALQSVPGLRNSLVITPDISGTAGLTIADCRFANIGDVITFDEDNISCDPSRIARLAGVIVKSAPGRDRHTMRGEVAETIRLFHQEGKKFRSKRKAGEAIQRAMKIRLPEARIPGRSVIEEEIDASEVGFFWLEIS